MKLLIFLPSLCPVTKSNFLYYLLGCQGQTGFAAELSQAGAGWVGSLIMISVLCIYLGYYTTFGNCLGYYTTICYCRWYYPTFGYCRASVAGGSALVSLLQSGLFMYFTVSLKTLSSEGWIFLRGISKSILCLGPPVVILSFLSTSLAGTNVFSLCCFFRLFSWLMDDSSSDDKILDFLSAKREVKGFPFSLVSLVTFLLGKSTGNWRPVLSAVQTVALPKPS